ncbi:MAG: glycoside hydrolase family 3 protein [Actinomycetales bacterium]|nr:glycoside hydrolase family 3 protein [Actinomycetales bacterium]
MATTTVVLIALALGVGACTAEAAPTPTSSPTPTPIARAVGIPDPLQRYTLAQKVGQLLMVGTPAIGPDPRTVAAVQNDLVGGIFLSGRSHLGVDATAGVVAAFTALLPAGSPPLLVATDQEGGYVQVLSGPGFSEIPSALDQGGMSPTALRDAAVTWGAELAAAGVTINLAPVADLLDPSVFNPPIADLDRAYASDPGSAARHAAAFAIGMRVAGVTPVLKHFPGLGSVTDNTDDTVGVVDVRTAPDGPQVAAFAGALGRGDAAVMMSLAVYAAIDPSAPAAFSPAVTTDLLRGTLGFDGVVITDDLSATDQVAAWSPGDRAILAVSAGCDLVLASADPGVAAEMAAALRARAEADPAFAARVDESARRVLHLKGVL